MLYPYVDSEIRWVVAPPELAVTNEESVFFDVDSYREKIIPLPQLKEEIFTYFAEHLQRPTSRLAYWNGERWRHPDGTAYDEVFKQAQVSAKNAMIKERFGAEGRGWDKAGKLIDDELPFLFISLPGQVYRTSYGAHNMTFLVEYVGVENGEKVGRVTSIPSREMDAVEHAQAVSSIVGEVVETDPNYLIANPLVAVALLDNIDRLANLDQMAVALGYKSYSEIVQLAQKSLEVEGDPFSRERRQQMVDYFVEAFHDAQSNVFYSEQKRLIIQKVLADKMRYYFALEAGSELLYKKFNDVVGDIVQNIQDGVKKFELVARGGSLGKLSYFEQVELQEIEERENWRMSILNANAKALDSYNSTGCVITTQSGSGSALVEGGLLRKLLAMDTNGESVESLELDTMSSEGEAVEWGDDGQPIGTKKVLYHVGCPLCTSCDVTAYITSTHICCGTCRRAKRLS